MRFARIFRIQTGEGRAGAEPDTCEVIVAAILVAPTLACAVLMAVRAVRPERPAAGFLAQTNRRPCLVGGLGIASEAGRCTRPSCVWTKSIFLPAALDLRSALRAAKPRVTYGGIWLSVPALRQRRAPC